MKMLYISKKNILIIIYIYIIYIILIKSLKALKKPLKYFQKDNIIDIKAKS